MVNCPKCGKINSDDAAFCTSCGESIHTDVGSTIERHAKQFAQNMEQAGKKVGDQMAQAAKKVHETTQKEAQHFEQRMDRVSHRAESWYERRFGALGPLLESFIFLIVFRLIIMVMELPNEETPEVRTVAAILIVYILPLFVLSLLSNYTQYLSRKFFQIKVFSPLLYATFFVLLCWIISKILNDASSHFTIPHLQTAALSLENSLPTIFVFVLLLGYVILALNLPKDHWKKP
ncbi:MAG TPA: zinc-ribbon domain-containing protein [Candidatus Thermoplasmatota archaeon]|nr:zinc-ribbon domain-containing protein [Candidatus Thermoplasmatota archaeon]